MDYRKYNNYLGWLVFIIATTVYFMTLEDTVSLWDCGEYITAAYKLEVGHPPGAPLFMVLGRLSSFFAAPEDVAVWINRLSALSSSATILFMFWSITLLVKKISLNKSENRSLSTGDKVAILGSGLIGSLAYTFSDSFWFSAVEGEVYAMSSLFTAIIFWAILKWDEEMMEIRHGQLNPTGYSPDRWLLFILFMLGLAIGVHLLGILVVPAIAFVIYFRFRDTVNFKGIFLVGLLSLIVLVFIQEGVIPGSIALASAFEIGFVTDLGLPFYSGAIFFFALLIIGFLVLLRYSKRKKNRTLYTAVMGLILLMIGYGSFAVIVIRSNANTPLDENDPENLVTFHSYLKRDQYGSAPLLTGHFWNSMENGGRVEVTQEGDKRWSYVDKSEWDDQSPIHLRRFVVSKNGTVIKAFKDEQNAIDFSATLSGSEVEETYFESNKNNRMNSVPTYAQTTFFPRMYWTQDQSRIDSYKEWSGYDPRDDAGTELGKPEKNPYYNSSQAPSASNPRNVQQRLPTASENYRFFFRYQINWMYFRYFFWNFSGRQNDIQGSRGAAMRGNWITGYSFIDNARLGDQDNAPYYTSENPANNKFFLLPLILGLIGLFFHAYRNPKDAFVVFLAFLFTGIAIVVYLNQKPLEPRERDYAYAGSFYFFTMWIGIGVYALYDAFKSFGKREFIKMGIIGIIGLMFFAAMDSASSPTSMPLALSWIMVLLIGGAAIAGMVGLRKVVKGEVQGASLAVLLGLFVPIIMGMQGWDDHDRSLKTSAHDLAYNYLTSCEDNGIIFTNGDNDTFPLWYMQEVEGKFTSVRVCNLSLMQTDWYTDQMKMKAYDSEALPIKFREDQILMNSGGTDQVLFTDAFNLMYNNAAPAVVEKVIRMRAKQNPSIAQAAVGKLASNVPIYLQGATSSDAKYNKRLSQLIQLIGRPIGEDLGKAAYEKFKACYEIFQALRSGTVNMDQSNAQAFQTLLFDYEKGWDVTNLTEAMAFVRDDANMVAFNNGQQTLRVFPSSGFVLPVNKENVLASKLISKEQVSDCVDEIKFRFTEGGLTREQVMILDVLANNDWKRPIYFSSPMGSKVGKSLYLGYGRQGRDGYVKQNGLAFELTPLKTKSTMLNRDKMYANLMENYEFGQMNNPDVLTDYYTRRHTVQYRSHFLRLAKDYAASAMQAQMMADMRNDTIVRPGELSQKEIDQYNERAIKLVKKSLEVMPAEIVIDLGEPNPNGNLDYTSGNKKYQSWIDGILHEYVDVLLLAGDKKAANELGMIVCDQLESVFNYYDNTDVAVLVQDRVHNTKDFYAALEAYMMLYQSSMDAKLGDPNGKMSKRIVKKLNEVYQIIIPKMVNELKQLASDRGEGAGRNSPDSPTTQTRFAIEEQAMAIGISYQYIEAPQTLPATQGGAPSGMTIPGNLPVGQGR